MNIPDKGRKIVLNSIITDNKPISVELTKSIHILDNQNYFNPLKGAEVILYENDIFIETLTQSADDKYISSYLLQKGRIYTIKATYENESVNSKTIIPNSVPVVITDFKMITKEYGDYLRATIQINDPSNEPNYYMLGFFTNDTNYNELYIDDETENPSFESYYQNYVVFSDESFNGKQHKITINVQYNMSEINNVVYAYLKSLSYDKYMYVKTLYAHYQSGSSPFSEPVMVYNNINNGYGIFAGYLTYMDSVIIF